MQDKLNWIHQKTIFEKEKFEINNVNIWDYKWEETGHTVTVKDPIYNNKYKFDIFKIKNDIVDFSFVAGEFSNCVWGIYIIK